MKKIFMLVFMFLFSSSFLFAEQKVNICDANTGEVIAETTIEELNTILGKANVYDMLDVAQKKGRVFVYADPDELKKDNVKLTIIWKNKKGMVLNTIKVEVPIKNINRIKYRNIAEYGFPISTFFAIMGFLILVL